MVTPVETQRRMLTGNAAAAWAARLAEIDYVPAFPITPQTEIIEALAAWFAEGALDGKFVTLDSEHSMITAAAAAAATGCRVFTATSQGLLYGLEALHTVAGWRVPFVLVNVSRGLALETGIWPLKEAVQGQVRHTNIPDRRRPVEEYLCTQHRFQHLFVPRRQDAILGRIQRAVDAYWQDVTLREGSERTLKPANAS